MIVTFIDPIANGLYNPTINPNNFGRIPNESGIYIYGPKLGLTVDNEIQNKFVPLYVGTTFKQGLQGRLQAHYNQLKTGGNSKKDLFDLTNVNNIADVQNLYKGMCIYDSYKSTDPKN